MGEAPRILAACLNMFSLAVTIDVTIQKVKMFSLVKT
jgi:hypothetical protein